MKCFQPVYIIRYFLPKVKFIFARVGFGNGWRMARDRPSPYGETETASPTVARGPVPRDRPTRAKNARQPRQFLVPIEAWRGTGPRPTVKERHPFLARSAGACPPRAFDLRENRSLAKAVFPFRPRHGEGQALALRKEGMVIGR